MTIFENREKGFEAQLKSDQELRFKSVARRNKLLGLWAADQMRLSKQKADEYAKAVVSAEFHSGGDHHIVETILIDLRANGTAITALELENKLEHFTMIAKRQVLKE